MIAAVQATCDRCATAPVYTDHPACGSCRETMRAKRLALRTPAPPVDASGARYVRAADLPRTFRIPSTYHAAGRALAIRRGNRVHVQWLGHTVALPLDARVLCEVTP